MRIETPMTMSGLSRRAGRAGASNAIRGLALALIAGCSSSHPGEGGGVRPQSSTETGNPPVIDVARVALVEEDGQVHVTGERGAVRPGGIEIEVTRLLTGEIELGEVEDDGSFDVRVPGSRQERYYLQATSADRSALSRPVFVARDGAMPVPDTGGDDPLRCGERTALIEARFEAIASPESECQSNEDCTTELRPVICPVECGSGLPVSHADRADITTVFSDIADAQCAPFVRDGCRGEGLTCSLEPQAAVCDQGVCKRCTAADECDAPEDSCRACREPELHWGTMGPVIDTAYLLTDCEVFVAIPGDRPQCRNEVPCLPAPGAESARWSVAAVQNLLGDPEVKRALQDERSFGGPDPQAEGFLISTPTGAIILSDTVCGGAPGCADAPQPVLQLRQLLEDIARQQEALCP